MFVINASKMRQCRLMFYALGDPSTLRKAALPYLSAQCSVKPIRVIRVLCLWLARTALKVPSFDGRSPTRGENSASPVIKSAVSNFPLHVNVPASRPTLPIRNSTGPENVTEFPSSRVHFASEGSASPQTLDCGSVTAKCLCRRFVHQSAGNGVAR